MNYRKGDTVLFVVGNTPYKGMITEKNGDSFTIMTGGVMGASTCNGRVRMVVGGTPHTVHKSMIMRKTG